VPRRSGVQAWKPLVQGWPDIEYPARVEQAGPGADRGGD
jgi:hypothetical protein